MLQLSASMLQSMIVHVISNYISKYHTAFGIYVSEYHTAFGIYVSEYHACHIHLRFNSFRHLRFRVSCMSYPSTFQQLSASTFQSIFNHIISIYNSNIIQLSASMFQSISMHVISIYVSSIIRQLSAFMSQRILHVISIYISDTMAIGMI